MTGVEIDKLVDMIVDSQMQWGELWLKQAIQNGLKQEWLTLDEAKKLWMEGGLDGTDNKIEAFL